MAQYVIQDKDKAAFINKMNKVLSQLQPGLGVDNTSFVDVPEQEDEDKCIFVSGNDVEEKVLDQLIDRKAFNFKVKKINVNEILREIKRESGEAKDIYEKFLDNPENPRGRAKMLIDKFRRAYGEDASRMAAERFIQIYKLTPEEGYILKYLTRSDGSTIAGLGYGFDTKLKPGFVTRDKDLSEEVTRSDVKFIPKSDKLDPDSLYKGRTYFAIPINSPEPSYKEVTYNRSNNAGEYDFTFGPNVTGAHGMSLKYVNLLDKVWSNGNSRYDTVLVKDKAVADKWVAGKYNGEYKNKQQ